ncbi:uncharacterized protein LOC114538196 [Dendronephthya gigantea]|uniref:uncharacterized protein LOC114538196 n=1 Tax=Dendronephthya gigantea TaxID=151771 RepID=UPI00106D22F5|nr:uncharacterized protein LOC114538196 [Dendronephthya gigantea]
MEDNTQSFGAIWKCFICSTFIAVTLKALMGHYFAVHSNEPNFLVKCGVDNCPAIFRRYHSFYKHVSNNHRQVYDSNTEGVGQATIPIIQINPFAINDEEDVDEHGPGNSNISSSESESESASGSDWELISDNSDPNENPTENQSFDFHRNEALFVLKVKERNSITQVALDNIIDCTSNIVNSALNVAKRNIISALESGDYDGDIRKTVTKSFEDFPQPFSSMRTSYLQTSYIKKNFNYVEIKEVLLGKKLSRKVWKNKRSLVEKDETFVYIPLIESLCQLLSNKRIAKLVIKKPNQCDRDIYYDICDGQLFRTDKFFSDHPDALQIIIYHDAVEVCNPLGSQAGKHKLDMFYYTLGNFNPKIRSKHCAIRLLGIANAKLVKKYGYNAILKPIIEDIKKIESGFPCVVNGSERLVYGKVISCTGDTEGQHEWGGYKVGVGFAFQKCRHCQCTYEAMQQSFYEEDFIQRTKESYNRHCDEIEQAPTDQHKNDLGTTYGINHRSPLCDLNGFDVTKQLPQDIMHTLLEGVVQYELRHILAYYMENGHFTLIELNAAIASQTYGYSEVSDRPGPLRESVFQGEDGYKLKFKASQTRLFLRLLPFILCSLIPAGDDYYTLVTELIELCQIIFSPVITLPTINLLKMKIGQHLQNFKEHFPGLNIIPKQHYMIHIPSMIKHLGPLIRHSCFGFESAHNYFKELARKQNFKNLPK